MTFDVLASMPQYAEHVAPVWEASVPRGTFWVTDDALAARHPGSRLANGRIAGPVLVASASDRARVRRMGARAVAYMEHGCGQSYAGDARTARSPAYAGGDGKDACGLILAPNGMAAARWRSRYPSVPVHVIGATRTLAPPEGEPLLVVAFHWNGAIPEQRNALAHYRDALSRLARSLPLAGHAHPRFAKSAREVFGRAGVEYIADVREVAARASVYAVDNSSTLWEMGLNRPVIALDAPWYRRHVEHGLRFWSHVPRSVDGPDALEAVASSLLSGESSADRERREAICRDVIPRTDGARAAARLIAAWASGTGA